MSAPLQRSTWLIFAGGFATSFLINQLLVGVTTARLPLPLKVVVGSWSVYLFIQVLNQWSTLEKTNLPWFTYMVSTSTIFYNVVICGILYLSYTRFAAVHPNLNRQYTLSMYAFLASAFLARMIRTILVYISNTGTAVFPASNVIHLATIFPILLIRLALDGLSLKVIYQSTMKRGFQSSHPKATDRGHAIEINKQQSANNEGKRPYFYNLVISLSFEIVLCFIAIVIAFLEAINYAYAKPALFDWILIAWTTHSYTEQKKVIANLFKSNVTSKVEGKATTIDHMQTIQKSKGIDDHE